MDHVWRAKLEPYHLAVIPLPSFQALGLLQEYSYQNHDKGQELGQPLQFAATATDSATDVTGPTSQGVADRRRRL
jgi:hypothetical protein